MNEHLHKLRFDRRQPPLEGAPELEGSRVIGHIALSNGNEASWVLVSEEGAHHELTIIFDGLVLPREHQILGAAQGCLRRLRDELNGADLGDTPPLWSRPESGPMRFGDDWCGVFVRGDTAAFALSSLDSALRALDGDLGEVGRTAILLALRKAKKVLGDGDHIEGAGLGRPPQRVQQLLPIEHCMLGTLPELDWIETDEGCEATVLGWKLSANYYGQWEISHYHKTNKVRVLCGEQEDLDGAKAAATEAFESLGVRFRKRSPNMP